MTTFDHDSALHTASSSSRSVFKPVIHLPEISINQSLSASYYTDRKTCSAGADLEAVSTRRVDAVKLNTNDVVRHFIKSHPRRLCNSMTLGS